MPAANLVVLEQTLATAKTSMTATTNGNSNNKE